MPRLQILHHKSYHPYNEKNKQRVREDEAKARAEELEREQRTIDTESEARLTLLRRRAGSPESHFPQPSSSSSLRNEPTSELLEQHRRDKDRAEKKERRQKSRLDFDWPSESKGKRGQVDERDRHDRGRDRRHEDFETGGHVNFWADLESGKAPAAPAPPSAADLAKRKAEQEADQFTVYLSRPDRETKPWYSDKNLQRIEDKETGERAEVRRARDRRKDARSKQRHDPLTGINHALASQNATASRATTRPAPSGGSERERALAQLAQREAAAGKSRAAGWETPEASWQDEFERRQGNAGRRFTEMSWDPRNRDGGTERGRGGGGGDRPTVGRSWEA